MVGLVVKSGQNPQICLKQFNKLLEKAGTLGEDRRRKFHQPPSVRKKLDTTAVKKRRLKTLTRSRNQLVSMRKELNIKIPFTPPTSD